MHGEKFNNHIKHYKTKQHASWLSIQNHFKSPKLEQLLNHSPSCLSSIEGAKWAYWCMAARPRASSIKLSWGNGVFFRWEAAFQVTLNLPFRFGFLQRKRQMEVVWGWVWLPIYCHTKAQSQNERYALYLHQHILLRHTNYLTTCNFDGEEVISRNIPIPSPWV